MSKYDAVYSVGNNQAINRIQVGSFKMRNRMFEQKASVKFSDWSLGGQTLSKQGY